MRRQFSRERKPSKRSLYIRHGLLAPLVVRSLRGFGSSRRAAQSETSCSCSAHVSLREPSHKDARDARCACPALRFATRWCPKRSPKLGRQRSGRPSKMTSPTRARRRPGRLACATTQWSLMPTTLTTTGSSTFVNFLSLCESASWLCIQTLCWLIDSKSLTPIGPASSASRSTCLPH